MRVRHVWAALGIVVSAATVAPSRTDAQVESKRAFISGRIRSGADTNAIAGADVRIVGSRERQITDAQGRFRFSGIYPGRYEVDIRRLGYTEKVKFVTVGSDERAFVTIDLDPAPQVLREVRVSGHTIGVPPRFEEVYRRVARGFGDFRTREDIQRLNPIDTKSLLLGIPGVYPNDYRIVFQRCSGEQNLFSPSSSGKGGDTRNAQPPKVQVWVDGVKMTRDDYDAWHVLRDVHPLDIEVMEIYRGVARIPAEFLDDACAVIAIWTRSY